MPEYGISKNRGRRTRRWREVIRPAAKQRDTAKQSPCWICLQPIDYDLPDGHADAWSPDHVYPVNTHPELAEDVANLRPSHLSCNKSRQDKVAHIVGMGAPSRQW